MRDFSKYHDDELLSVLSGGASPGSPIFEGAKAALEHRRALQQLEAAERQAKAAEDLRVFSGRLVLATWALVAATVGLVAQWWWR